MFQGWWIWVLHLLEKWWQGRWCQRVISSKWYQRRWTTKGKTKEVWLSKKGRLSTVNKKEFELIFFCFFCYCNKLIDSGPEASDNTETASRWKLCREKFDHLQWLGHGQHQLHQHYLQRCPNSNGTTKDDVESNLTMLDDFLDHVNVITVTFH